MECISKGKIRNPYQFGVKVGLAITLKCNLIAGASRFPGNPYEGHPMHEQIEQRHPDLRPGRQARGGVLRPRLPGCGLGQPGHRDQTPRPRQAADRLRAQAAQKTASDRADHRAPQS